MFGPVLTLDYFDVSWLVSPRCEKSTKDKAMSRTKRVLLGTALVFAMYLLPEVQFSFLRNVLEAMAVIHLCFDALKD